MVIIWTPFTNEPETPIDILGLVLPNLCWLLIPILIAIVLNHILDQKQIPFFDKAKEYPMIESDQFLSEFLCSAEKIKFGPACDRVGTEGGVVQMPRTGGIVMGLEMAGRDYVVRGDGRVDPPNGNRCFTLMLKSQMFKAGFPSIYEMEQKLTAVESKGDLRQTLYDMDDEDRQRFYAKAAMSSNLKEL